MNHFGLLGEHLAHSFSPLLHSMLGNYEYCLYEKSPDEVGDFLCHGDFDGLNVTIPYKKTVIPYCTAFSDTVGRIGSVNTLVRRADGTLFGDNTDYDGFLYLLNKLCPEVADKKALVLGSGGASLTAVAVLRDRGALPVVVSRTGAVNYNTIHEQTDARIIVNTTPVGMYPDNGKSPLDLRAFPRLEAVADVIYNPAKTALLLDSKELGIPCINGLPMLAAQAKRAAEIFTGRALDDGLVEILTESIARRTKNVILIGMPGSGKSFTGAALAKLLGREFYDTDELVVKAAGKSIPDILNEDGEDVFRSLETEALRGVSKLSGTVIATGGGIVKRPENLRLIRQNGTAIFLKRDLSELSSDGRPLSQQNGVEAIARERLPIYESWSDIEVEAVGVAETAERIKELLGL